MEATKGKGHLWTVAFVSGILTFSTLVFTVSKEKSFSHPDQLAFESENSGDWTLQRKGYEPLEFFTSSEVFLKYDFLEKYSAIVEPDASMQLRLMNSAGYSDIDKVEFSVCPEDDEEDCGGKVQKYPFYVDSLVSNDFTVSCSPFDELVVTIYNSAADDDAKSEEELAKFSAVCM